MDRKEARAVLERNVRGLEGSFVYELHEESTFSAPYFWELYDGILALAEEAVLTGRTVETAGKIAFVYQYFLKSILYHFDEGDLARLEGLPENYTAYMERLEGAIDAYFKGVWTEEDGYGLERPAGGPA